MGKRKKLVILGLDGGSWDLLNQLIKEGYLPTLKHLLKEGAHGTLRSAVPPITGPAWVSFATGKNPGKHGCFGFLTPRDSLGEITTIDSNFIKGETFYEILDRHDQKCILINLPCSSPPRIKSTVISSFLTPGNSYFTPKSLLEEIPVLRNYRVTPDFTSLYLGEKEAFFEDVRRLARERFNIARELFVKKNWDFFFLLFGFSDTLQHKSYGELLEGRRSLKREKLLKSYQDFDRYLKFFIENLPSQTNFLLVSDHGFEKTSRVFYINRWLAQKGYLKTKNTLLDRGVLKTMTAKWLAKTKSKRIKNLVLITLFRIFLRSPIFLSLLGVWLRMIFRFFPSLDDGVLHQLATVGLVPDFSQTVAYSLPGMRRDIYINDKKRFKDGLVGKEKYDKIRREICQDLKALKDEKGKKIFSHVWLKEDVYQGKHVEDAPDILLEAKGVILNSELYSHKVLLTISDNWHAMDGVFLAWGPDIKKGVQDLEAELLDIAPTALFLLGLGASEEMDGKVLKKILNKKAFHRFKKRRPSQLTRRESLIEKKVQRSKKIVEQALHRFPIDRIVLGWTGGKDSTLLLWIVKRICGKNDLQLPKIMFIDEGDVFPEVKQFTQELIEKWKLKVNFIRNDDVLKQVKKTGDLICVKELSRRNQKELKRLGFKGRKFPFKPESFIGNHLMKTVAMNIYLEENKIQAVITGIRHDEQEARSGETYFSPRENPSHIRVHPLLHFKEEDVWQAIHHFKIPYVKLYKDGYRSLGARRTTKKASDLPAWQQDLEHTTERIGRQQDKEKVMERLRELGYM